MIGTLDSQVIKKFKEFQNETGKYFDLEIKEVEFDEHYIFNDDENVKLIGSKKIASHEELAQMNDIGGLPVYDASININTYVGEEKYPNQVFEVQNNENPDISFASEGNSSAGTNFIIHRDKYYVNNHRTVIQFTNKYYSKYIYYNIFKMKDKYGFKRGYTPSQSELKKLEIAIPLPKNYNEKYKSFDIQKIIVEFFEYNFNNIDNIKKNIDKRYDIVKRLKKSLVPSTFKQDIIQKRFHKYAKENGIDFDITDIQLESKVLEDISEIIKAGATPKKSNLNWTSLNDLEGIPWLDIDRTEFEKFSIETFRKKITNDGLNSCSTWIVPENSLMITIGGSLGFVGINKFAGCTNQNILSVVLKKEYFTKYIMYSLEFFYMLNIRNRESSYGNLSKRTESAREVLIPKSFQKYSSYEIQKIIADFIEYVDNELNEKYIKKFERAHDVVERLKTTYLARTFSLINWEKINE